MPRLFTGIEIPAAIGQQLEEIASAMEARGIAPGGERALRLFS